MTEVASTSAIADNPDRAFIADVVSRAAFGENGVALDTNAVFRALGARITAGKPGAVEVACVAGADCVQGNGVVGGGAIATMLDCAMAVATLSAIAPGKTCSTTSLTVNMLAAGQVGRFRAEAALDRLGGRVAFVSARLFDGRERLVATGTSTLLVLDVQ